MTKTSYTKPTVYIPSRGRPSNVPKLLRAWLIDNDFRVNFVVESQDYHTYNNAINASFGSAAIGQVNILTLPQSNQGVGFARNYAIEHADMMGHDSIILSDDDIKPDAKSDWLRFLDHAVASRVLGVTARYSYHDFALGPKVRDRRDLILLPSGTFRLIALNVNNVMELGNYDVNLTCVQEDGDLMLRGIGEGFPWMIDLATHAISMGARYAPGGLSEYFDERGDLGPGLWARKESERECHKLLYAKHPDYVNDPTPIKPAEISRGNGVRIKWQKCYDREMSDWRSWSALHGGELRGYFA